MATCAVRAARTAVIAAMVLLASCAMPRRGPAVPHELSDDATVLSNPALRTWGTSMDEPFFDELVRAAKREHDLVRGAGATGVLPPANFLALSGGGEYGAYGAGLLCGWTTSGLRPEFNVVTGVSTGALIAPFAFLGPDFDDKLRQGYTSVTTDQLIRRRSVFALFFDDGLFDTAPLRRMLAEMVDQEVVDAIAREYARGRVLLVATTNLDVNAAVIWNITAIAATGDPGALDLIHDVLLASASIPAAFPPVMIDVEVGDTKYQEMHVDGAAKSQVFLFPTWLDFESHDTSLGIERERRAFVILNARMEPTWEQVPRRTGAIALRSIDAFVRSQGIGNIFRIAVLAGREGVDFNLAYVPPSFDAVATEPFDPVFMTKLFEVGYDAASAPGGYPWAKTVPTRDLRMEPEFDPELTP